MRCFLGIGLDEEVKDRVSKVKEGFKDINTDIKFVDDDNLHWTVKFLGDLDQNEINRVEPVKDVTSDFTSFNVELKGMGAFPSLDYIKVIWVGAGDGGSKLKRLIEEVDSKLQSEGFEPEDNEIVPHLTIGRMKSGRNKEKVKSKIEGLKGKRFGKMNINSIKLYKSELTPEGPIYDVLREFELNE